MTQDENTSPQTPSRHSSRPKRRGKIFRYLLAFAIACALWPFLYYGIPEKLSFKEQKEYENLSKEIETLEKEIADIEASFSTIDSRDYEKMLEAKSTYDEKNRVLEEKFIRYMELDERA